MHLTLGKHQHLHGVAVQGVFDVVGRNLHILAAFFVGHDVGLAGLLHVDGADDVVLRQQVVFDVLWIDFIFTTGILVLNQYLGFGKFLYGGKHQLPGALVVGSDARSYLFVVEGVEWVVGKYL